MQAKFVRENIDFKRKLEPKESLGLGIFRGKTPQDFMDFIMKEMEWNNPGIEFNPYFLIFSYDCLPGGSVISELKEAVYDFGWSDLIKVGKDPNDDGSRNYDDGATGHYYILQFKAKYRALAFEKFGLTMVNENSGVGGYSADQCERDARDILKKEYGHMDIEERDIKKFLKKYIEPAFERDDIYDYDSLYDFILQGQI